MTHNKRIAYLSMDEAYIESHGYAGTIHDWRTQKPLEELGWHVTLAVPWREHATVDWHRFDVLVIRSPWDYQLDPDAFVAALEAIQAANPALVIENPIETVRWNISKRYLADLRAGAVPIVPTQFHAWEAADAALTPAARREKVCAVLRAALRDAGEIVVKPMVSAGSDFTYRVDAAAAAEGAAPAAWMLAATYLDEAHRPAAGKPLLDFLADVFSERDFLVQPFVSTVLDEGELSLFYFDGRLSHAMRKVPAGGDFRVQEMYDGVHECVAAADVPRCVNALCEATLALVPPRVPLYARVDCLRLHDSCTTSPAFADTCGGVCGAFGGYCVMEVEVNEPSLYFNLSSSSAENFARAVEDRCSTRIVSERGTTATRERATAASNVRSSSAE